jgi:hypothetical protein
VGLVRNAAGQLKVTDSNTGWGSIYASAHVTNGGTSSQFVKGDGSLDSSAYLTSTTAGALYVPYNGHVTRSAPFGQLALTHQLVNNVLYSAASRFTVTTNLNGGGATTLTNNTLFNGFYDQQGYVIPSGQNAVFEIDFTSKGGPAAGIVYPGGYIRIHYYSTVGTPTVTGTLTYQNLSTASLTFTNVGQGAYTVNHATVPGTNYVTKMSITITNTIGSSIGVAQIEYFMSREGQYATGVLNKFEDNTVWTDLIMKNSTANTNTIYQQASTGRQYLYTTPVATPALGQFMMGSGPWDGSSAGYFRGNANGTWMAINTISATANFLDFQYNQSTGTGHRWSVGYNGAVSWITTTNGAVSAAASISYSSYLRLSANNATKVEGSGLNVGNTGLNLSEGHAVIQNTLSVGAAASVLSGATLSLGTASSSSTASPVVLSMGGTFSSSAGANPKLRLYDDGTPSNTYGIGVSAGQLDYIVPNATHNFYANGSKYVTIGATGITVTGSIVKSGGTSAQFLKADGSVDSNTYLTSASLSGYVPYTGATASLNLGSWNFSNTGSITGGTFSHSTGNNIFNSTGGQFQIGSTSTTGSFTFEPANPAFEIIRHSTLDIATLQPTYLSFKQGANNFSVFISSQTLTANRNIAFPNQSGTVALTSDITSSVSGYVPYTGASTNLNLGANNLSTTGTITVGGAAAVFNSGSVVLSNTTTTDVLAINKANFRALFVEYVIYFVNSQLVGSFMVSNASGTVELGGHQVTAEIGTIPTHTITVTSDSTNAIVRVSQFSISGYTMKMIYRYI